MAPPIVNGGEGLKDVDMAPEIKGLSHDDPMSVPENMQGIHGGARLSPTPRKSERERKNISYDKLNKGAANSDEEFDNPLERTQSMNFRDMRKKSTSTPPDAKKNNEEVVAKVEKLFEYLNSHQYANLFNPISDPNHPACTVFAKCQHLLYMIDQRMKMDSYQNTSQIGKEIRIMI